ncbi:cyclic nucleotide-binding domain-containing protein [Blastomonas sp. AAP53]|uniref:Crp/Fnr family transcriptional regulator n=1 Tax=Blastomonas sp. AAP53 TaxID=1248760 RepID=UPI00058DD2CE|nr:cyclic nucleotide-binding domain-containing protein [Blastomonas sp. AAP53]
MTLGLGFSDGAWLGHLAFMILAIALIAPPMPWMRVGIVLSSIAGLGYALGFANDLGLALWFFVLLVTGASMLLGYLMAERNSRFSSEEEALRASFMDEMTRAGARHLMDQGNWITGRADEILINEGEAISHLFYLHDGAAQISLHGNVVGQVGSGDLIGDATALSGEPATGTVRLIEDSRFWCVSAPKLRQYLELHPDARTVIERQINSALDRKLRAANAALASS